jgi:preprotein translocase subunit SecE
MAEVQSPAGALFKDKALGWLSVLVLLAGIVAFYWFDEQPLLIRVAMVIIGVAQAARVELRKVVWPERDETVKTTYVVFGFAVLMGLFFWFLDMGLTFLTRLLGGQTG